MTYRARLGKRRCYKERSGGQFYHVSIPEAVSKMTHVRISDDTVIVSLSWNFKPKAPLSMKPIIMTHPFSGAKNVT